MAINKRISWSLDEINHTETCSFGNNKSQNEFKTVLGKTQVWWSKGFDSFLPLWGLPCGISRYHEMLAAALHHQFFIPHKSSPSNMAFRPLFRPSVLYPRVLSNTLSPGIRSRFASTLVLDEVRDILPPKGQFRLYLFQHRIPLSYSTVVQSYAACWGTNDGELPAGVTGRDLVRLKTFWEPSKTHWICDEACSQTWSKSYWKSCRTGR